TQCLAGTSRFPELLRQPNQRIVCCKFSLNGLVLFRGHRIGLELILIEPAACFLDRVEQRLLVRKMPEQGGEICKGLVKGRDLAVGSFREIGANTVEHGMSRLVNNDVMREACEYGLSRKISARLGFTGSKIAEQYPLGRRRIRGVGRDHR